MGNYQSGFICTGTSDNHDWIGVKRDYCTSDSFVAHSVTGSISASPNKEVLKSFWMKDWRIKMKAILDFLTSALPWIAIGLFVACSCVTVKVKK